MVKNEEYIDYLKKVIACVSNGDYYSIKEFSVLKLKKIEKDNEIMKKQLNKYIKSKKYLKNQNNDEIIYLYKIYIEYLLSKLDENKEIKEVASIEDFIRKIK